MRIAVTMEPESWIIRRIAERFREFAGDDCEVVMVLAHEPLPEEGIDAVLYSDWPHYLLQPAKLRQRIPAVLMVHHIDRFAFRLRWVAFRRDLRLTCMSRRWVRFLRRWTFPANKLVQMHYGVDMTAFHPADQYEDKQRICIGVVGRLYPGGRKGEDRLLAIAHQLDPEKFQFQFMGERWDEIIAELRTLGFAVEVAYRCSETEQPKIYRRMDCLLVCSRNEGGPLPVLEALASGVPVISSNVGFVPELKELLPYGVKVFDTVSFAVTALHQTRHFQQELRQCRVEVKDKLMGYSWNNWAKNMKQLLCEVVTLRQSS